MEKINYNLIRKGDSEVIRTWNMGVDYKDKIHLVFNNEMDKIKSGEYIVVLGTLPRYFELVNGEVVELEPPKEASDGLDIKYV